MPETEPTPLPHDDPQFELFQIACAMHELVRVRYYTPTPEDPAILGIDTVSEGHAMSIDAKTITFTLTVLEPEAATAEAMQKVGHRVVARDKVLEIHRIGPGSPVFEGRA